MDEADPFYLGKDVRVLTEDVDIANLVAWIQAIPFEAWPQQQPWQGQLRPAMVNKPTWHNFEVMASPVVGAVMAHLPKRHRPYDLMLSVVMPGHEIARHVDQQIPNWVCRVHVPLVSNLQAEIVVADVPYVLLPGVAYVVNVKKPHSVVNRGETPRIHFMFNVCS